jgi:drug/metabolite transporter (DMT)-like permease
VTAVLFGILGGFFFGVLSIAIQAGLRRGVNPEAGAVVTAAVGFVLASAAALVDWGEVDPGELWPFFVAGLLVPGLSQILFIKSVRDAGPARASILVGTAPLMSVLIAVTLLDEPWKPALFLGTLLVVAGGAVLTRERVRPEHFRALGAVLALTCAVLFACRDNIVRLAAREHHPPPLVAAATSLLAASIGVALYLTLFGRPRLAAKLRGAGPAFWPAGVALGLAYSCLLVAFSHGRVSVVAPLNATQSMWAVLLAALLLHRTELIGRKVVVACVLVVAGGALIGAVR